MIKVLKIIFISILALIGFAVTIGLLFLTLSPQFGGEATEQEQISYAQTGHFQNGIFINREPIEMEINCHSIKQMLRETLHPDPDVAPSRDIKVNKISSESILNKSDSLVRLTWFGHSSFLIEMDGKNILLDPVFGQFAAPHPLLGRRRFNSEMPITIAELPSVDAVIISHDHYDHLDYESIRQLSQKTDQFFVPLGVDNHLERWGVEESKITKMDWWQEREYEDIFIAFTPSRHMSGRRLNDQSATLWGSWVLKGKTRNIFFSGDGGYGSHFKEIGEKYGEFDIALMECGQYNILWRDVHLMPEETVVAGMDVKAKMIVPIHWGSFSLSSHAWTDPIERVTKAAQKNSMPLATPQIGEPIVFGQNDLPHSEWWKTVQ